MTTVKSEANFVVMNDTTKIETRDALAKLERIGFSQNEAKVFFVLYQGWRMSATEIAKEAKIKRPSVYSILRSFAEKGFCNEIDTPSKQYYEIIAPEVIEDKLSKKLYDTYQSNIRNTKDCFTVLKPVFKSKRASEYVNEVELVRGYNLHREKKFLDLIKNSHKAILYMNRIEGLVSSDLDKESVDFHKRGGVVKSIYEDSTNFKVKLNNKWQNVTREDLIRFCESFEKQGEQIRLLKEVPQIMAVFDDRTVFFSLYDESIPKREMTDVIIKNKRFAKFIIELFNLYWDKSMDLNTFKNLFTNKLN